MTRPRDLLDQIYILRDLLLLTNLAAQALDAAHERNAIERGTILALDLLEKIEADVDDEDQSDPAGVVLTPEAIFQAVKTEKARRASLETEESANG